MKPARFAHIHQGGLIILFLAALFLSAGMMPTAASAESVSQLQRACEDAKTAYEAAVSTRDDIDSQLDDARNEKLVIKDSHSQDLKQVRSAVCCLYKLGNSGAAVARLLLDAESLEEALASWEYLTVVVESNSGKLQQMEDELAAVEARESELLEKRASAEFAVAEAETSLYKAKGELDSKQAEVDALLSTADNTALARLSASMAYSRKVRYCDGYPATAAYKAAWEYVFPGDGVPCGRSCDRGVAIPVRLAGWDDDFPRVCRTQFDYVKGSSKWMDLGVWDSRISSLEPGDVLISISGIDGASYEHSCMYVGYDIAQEMYESVIRGTDGDLGRPGTGDVFSSASYQWGSSRGRALCLCWDGEAGSHVFRCVHPDHSGTYSGFKR